MDSIEAILFTLLGALLILIGWRTIVLYRGLEALASMLSRDAATLLDLRYRQEADARMKRARQKTGEALAGGFSALRGLHFELSRIPFGALASVPGLGRPTRLVQGVHDLVSSLVYGSLEGVGSKASEFARRASRGDDE